MTCPRNPSTELGLELGLRALLSVLLLSYPKIAKNLTNPPGSVSLDGSASASHLAQAVLEEALFTVGNTHSPQARLHYLGGRT